MLLSPVVILALAVLVPGFIEAVKVDRCEHRNQLINLTSTHHTHERKEQALATVICELEILDLSLTVDANATGAVRVKRAARALFRGQSKKKNDTSTENNSAEHNGEEKDQPHSNSTRSVRVKHEARGPFSGPFNGGHSQEDSSAEDSSEGDSSVEDSSEGDSFEEDDSEGDSSVEDSSEGKNQSLSYSNSTEAVRVKRGAHGQSKKGHSKENSSEGGSSVEDSNEAKNQSLSYSNSTRAVRVKRGAHGRSKKGQSKENSSEGDSSEEMEAMTNMTLADCVAVDNNNVTVNATCIKLVFRKVFQTASAKCKNASPNEFFLTCPSFVPLLTPPTPKTPETKSKKENDKGKGGHH